MPINFPTRTRTPVAVIGAPFLDRGVGQVQAVIGTEMHRCSDRPRGCDRTDDLSMPGERTIYFDAYFQINHFVQVERHVPACPDHLLLANNVPDRAATLWNHPSELL